jgi:hypothetical protein
MIVTRYRGLRGSGSLSTTSSGNLAAGTVLHLTSGYTVVGCQGSECRSQDQFSDEDSGFPIVLQTAVAYALVDAGKKLVLVQEDLAPAGEARLVIKAGSVLMVESCGVGTTGPINPSATAPGVMVPWVVGGTLVLVTLTSVIVAIVVSRKRRAR